MDSNSKTATVKGYPTSSRLEWTPELDRRFVNAVEKLGRDKAVPKKIVHLMKVKGLTRCHVASHLQKYRDVKKKLSRANHKVETATQPLFLESSPMTIEAPHNKSSSMLDQNQHNGMHGINLPILDTSQSHVLLPEPSFDQAHLGSLPNEGYSMQAMAYNLDEQRNIFDDASDLTAGNSVNSSYPGFVQNLDGFNNDYASYSTKVHQYNNIETGSSSDGVPHKNSTMNWNNENPIVNEIRIGEDDHSLWQEGEIAFRMSLYDDNGDHKRTANTLPVTPDTPNQDLNGQNLQNSVSFDSNHNEHQSSNGYLLDFDHTFNKRHEVVILDSPNQDVNEQNFPNTFSFDSEEETRGINEHQTLDAYLPGYGSTSEMDVNAQKFPNTISFYSNEETTPFNEHQTLDGYLPGYDPAADLINAILDTPNEDVNEQNFQNNVSFDSNEETPSINKSQTFDELFPGFDQITFDMNNDEQSMAPIWSPEPVVDDTTFQVVNPDDQDRYMIQEWY